VIMALMIKAHNLIGESPGFARETPKV
jgi:hypothetical protein